MTPVVTRRTVPKTSALGTALAVTPVRLFSAEAAAAPAPDGIFGYGVASGDPTATAVILWTRATPPRPGRPAATPGSGLGGPLPVSWQVARDPAFRSVVAQGRTTATAATDHTVKVDVTGLAPYTRYHCRFRALGQTSAAGVTRTAPDIPDKVHALRLALVSCSNYTGGYFSAYRAIARRDDLDFVLHVGDYIYEYGNGADRYGPPTLIGRRDAVPPVETIDLVDDHEVANNAWATNAENHTNGEEGTGVSDPDRHLPEPEQLRWLTDGLTATGRPWHLVGNQTVFSPVRFPGDALGVPGTTLLNSDQWDGYQADQATVIRRLDSAPPAAGDTVFLTGDIHSSWALDVPVDRARYLQDRRSAGVEIVCPSVTSDGSYEVFTGGAPSAKTVRAGLDAVAAATDAVRATNPWVRYLDGVGHG